MKQLEMRRISQAPLSCEIPEGYSVINYSALKEKKEYFFIHYSKDGSLGEEDEFFDKTLTTYPDCVPSRDTFFLKHGDEYVGTVTAVFHPKTNSGYLHMVCIRADHRGKGLAALLNAIAVNKLLENGPDYIMLTTDDWRVPAIKSYLKAGFLPVMNETWLHNKLRMFLRWKKIYKKIGSDTFEYLTLNTKKRSIKLGDK